MASEREKATYLEGRVGYEVVMLNFIFMRLMTARPSTQEEQLDVNAYMKSFAVHALNLIEFLCDKSWTDDHGASNYTSLTSSRPTKLQSSRHSLGWKSKFRV